MTAAGLICQYYHVKLAMSLTYPYCVLMLSTPAPIPISIIPVLIWLATSTQACSPEEHCLFNVLTAAVSGNPATKLAARISVAPPPGASTVPTQISSTRAGLILERSMVAFKTPAMRSAAAVSLKPPLPPLVRALRQAEVTTTSSGRFSRIFSRPPAVGLPVIWPPSWEILSRAGKLSVWGLSHGNLEGEHTAHCDGFRWDTRLCRDVDEGAQEMGKRQWFRYRV